MQVVGSTIVDSTYLSKIAGISFESATTSTTGAGAFTTHILQMTLHGATTASLCQ
jgi:hypothetical protein